MREILKSIIKEITPPFILRGVKMAILLKDENYTLKQEEGEKCPEWYDTSFENSDYWQRHYSESYYYFLWTVIADRVVRAEIKSILEIGCGSGQLAA